MVLLHDDRANEKEQTTLVFPHTGTNKVWKNLQYINSRIFKPLLNKAGIRCRPIDQCRHKFASQMLTIAVADRRITKQMGHSSIAISEQHFGQWMSGEIQRMAQRISEMQTDGTDEAIRQKKKSFN